MKTFEEFMQEQTPIELLGGGADGAQEGFENWISGLDASEMYEYAELYGKQCYEEGKKKI